LEKLFLKMSKLIGIKYTRSGRKWQGTIATVLKIHCVSNLAELEKPWKALAAASERATIFQTWEWSAAWWRHNKRGKTLFVLVCQDEQGRVIGLAPLFRSVGTLQLIGTGGSDYLDFLTLPGVEEAVAQGIGAWLQENRSRWLWADLQQVAPGGAAASLPAATILQGETCPFLPLPESYESFLKTLSKKHRQNIGYYERSMAKTHALERRVATSTTLPQDMEAFFSLHQLRWRGRWMPGAFASSAARALHTDAAASLLESGNLRLHTLWLDGKAVAAIYCFHKGTTTYYYLGGFDPALAKLSPGTVLTAKAIQYAIEQDGATTFDFLRGDEGYKYRWGAQDRYNQRVSLTPEGLTRPLGALLETSGRLALSLELRLKHAMHARQGGIKVESKGKSKENEIF
jgi:CelD/BcsL family acetyltransferase involved in cellulose biosynthesis